MALSNVNFNLYSNTNVYSKLGDVAAKVALQNFDLQYTTFLFFNTTIYYGVEVFLRVFGNKVLVNRGTFNSKLTKRVNQYVFFGSDVADLEQLLDVIREFEMDNTGKFIIICQSTSSTDCDENDLTQLLWVYKVVNVVIIKADPTEAVSYTYYPSADGVCNNTTPVKLVQDQYVSTTYGKVYEMKLKNLHLCPIMVSTFIQTPYMNITSGGKPIGADGDLLVMIAEGLNTSLKVRTPFRGDGWGWRQSNGTWMGSLADVDEEIANFSMTSAALTLSRFSDFEMSQSYYTTSVVWVTHPAQMQNVALKLMHPFRTQARIALLMSFLLVLLCAFLIKTDSWTYMCRKVELVEPSKSIVFYAWMICMGQAVIKLPSKSVFLQMTVIWVWYCFLIRTAYQVYLISSLKGKFFEGQFDTIEDAIGANYPFGGGAALRDYFIDYPTVYENWINIDTVKIIPTVVNISKGMKFVLAMSGDTANVVIKKYKVTLHVLPQKVVTSPTVVFFKKYSPLTQPVNLVLSRLTSSGFPDKLHKIYTSVRKSDDNSNEGETLKLVHFTACYIILIIGWVLSFIFFMLEIYFGKIYRHPAQE